ncbi:MAG TPA: hypothetical protein VF132_03220 [Rudaea sp.]
MKRFIYAFDTADAAREAVRTLRAEGLDDRSLSLIARSDIEMEEVPSRLLDASTDFMPALARGAALGGATGLVAGLIAIAIPPLGITMAGPAIVGFLAGGAVIGAWTSSMAGAGVPDEIRRKFEQEIESGHTLLVADSDGKNDAVIAAAMAQGSDRHLIWQSEVRTPGV